MKSIYLSTIILLLNSNFIEGLSIIFGSSSRVMIADFNSIGVKIVLKCPIVYTSRLAQGGKTAGSINVYF